MFPSNKNVDKVRKLLLESFKIELAMRRHNIEEKKILQAINEYMKMKLSEDD